MNTLQQTEVENATRRFYFPPIHWGAIAAGVVTGLSIHVFFTLLGMALGISAIEIGEGVTVWAMLWSAISMLVAAFIGGYVAARMSGLKRTSDGVLHGFVSWSVTTLLFAALAASVAGAVFGGAFNRMYGVTQSGSTDLPAGAMLGQKLEALVKGNDAAAPDVDPAVVQTLQYRIQTGQRDSAIDVLVNSLGFQREHAVAVVDQALLVNPPDGDAAAARAVKDTNLGTWTLLGAVSLSLLFGIVGGSFGSAASRSVPRADSAVEE
jgi:hypothetical protein